MTDPQQPDAHDGQDVPTQPSNQPPTADNPTPPPAAPSGPPTADSPINPPVPPSGPLAWARRHIKPLAIAASAVVVLAIAAVVVLPRVLPDSGVEACKAMAANTKTVSNTEPSGDEDKLTQEEYDKIRDLFADSRYDDIREPGLRLIDTVWGIQNTPRDDELGAAFAALGTMMQDMGSLRTGCKNHGVQINFANDVTSQPTTAPSATVESLPSPSVSSAPPEEGEIGMPTYRVGQAFETKDVTGNAWRIKVTSFRCDAVERLTSPGGASLAEQPDVAGTEDACVVELTYTNVGMAAAEFFGGFNENLSGTDARGRLYDATIWASGKVNPDMSDKNQLMIPVSTGTKLASVMIGDAIVNLK
ncbi:MAG TPA: hypothetical protein VFY84_03970 [Jiangellales bacterium]|nr:hypothetical protein [Jiangellales bacterium]